MLIEVEPPHGLTDAADAYYSPNIRIGYNSLEKENEGQKDLNLQPFGLETDIKPPIR